MRFLLTVFLCISATVVCGAQAKDKDPFVGLKKQEVIRQYGQPTLIERVIAGGERLIYKRSYTLASARAQSVHTAPAVISGSEPSATIASELTKGNTGGNVIAGTHTYTFVLDKRGKVISWSCA